MQQIKDALIYAKQCLEWFQNNTTKNPEANQQDYHDSYVGGCDQIDQALELLAPFPAKAEQQGLRWVQGEYEKLYQQVKSGKRSVCYVDYQFSGEIIARDICTIRNDDRMELGARGIGYGSIWHNASSSQLEEFIKVCESLNVEWLESTTPSVKDQEQYSGSVFSHPAPGIALGCISPEARYLLDVIMAAWEPHYAGLQKNEPTYDPTFYGFAYWLVRWSGLVQPATSAQVKEAGQPANPPNFDELWDEFSEDSILTEAQYDRLVAKFKFLQARQQPAGESAQHTILTEMHNKETYFRLENDETGFYLSIIDRSKYPRIWADNLQSGSVAIIAESADNLINRTISSEQDWAARFHGETIQECFKEYEQPQNNKP